MDGLNQVLDHFLTLDPIPLVLAVVLGGAIGLERELHGRPAGLRTHAIVCLAATLLIEISHHLPAAQIHGARVVLDPTRMAAGIVTGIGFLGAATVIRAGDLVRGITTGACVWSVSALGIVIGYGAYGLAITGTILILGLLVFLNSMERRLPQVVYRRVIVKGGAAALGGLAPRVREILLERGVRVLDMHVRVDSQNQTSEFTFYIRCNNLLQGTEIAGLIANLEGVTTAEWATAF